MTGVMRRQTGESWNKVVRPKALGAWNLDAVTRDLASLEHFVCFSSIVATLGNAGAPCPRLSYVTSSVPHPFSAFFGDAPVNCLMALATRVRMSRS